MQIVKGFPSTSQDDYQLNVTNIIKHGARNFGRQEIASRKPDGTMFRYSYSDAYVRVQKLAGALKSLGAEIGDRIGVMAWNTHENFEMYFGIPGMGAVMLMLNIRLSPQDLLYVATHAAAKYIVVDETLIPLAEVIAPELKHVKGYIVITDKRLSEIKTELKPVYSYNELLDQAEDTFEWPNLDETSAYAACYTTGTTGKPKGVYYSHRDVYLHTMSLVANAEVSMRDCFFQIVPMFHVLGWGSAHAATMVGAKFVLPGMYNLDRLEELGEILVQEKVTVSNGAPALLMPMLEYIKSIEEKPDLKGARLACGATEPPKQMMKDYWDMTGAEVVHSYGATETTPMVTINRMKPWLESELTEDEKWDLKRKQGYCVVGLDIKVVGSEGETLPNDGRSAGEIYIRGPWVTRGYYDDPGSEKQFTEDGYWRSGDAGTIDPEGYLKITDRVKDLIKSGGEWISSVDMENEIICHPDVTEAAVVGLSHPKWEERPLALVVLREGSRGHVTKEDIINLLGHKFAKWQLPNDVLFVEVLPKTSVGKIDKKVIREEYKNKFHL